MKKGTCQSTSTHASQLVKKKKKKNGMKKYTQSKHQSKKSANQKTIKQQKPFHRKMENSMLKKPQEAKNGRGSGHHEITSFPRSWHHEKTNHHAVSVPGPRKPFMKNAAAEGAK
jgi:deoxyribodipyrimidine photolyase